MRWSARRGQLLPSPKRRAARAKLQKTFVWDRQKLLKALRDTTAAEVQTHAHATAPPARRRRTPFFMIGAIVLLFMLSLLGAYLDCAPAAAFVKGGEEGAEERRETRRDVRPDDINAELDDDEQLADDAQAVVKLHGRASYTLLARKNGRLH